MERIRLIGDQTNAAAVSAMKSRSTLFCTGTCLWNCHFEPSLLLSSVSCAELIAWYDADMFQMWAYVHLSRMRQRAAAELWKMSNMPSSNIGCRASIPGFIVNWWTSSCSRGPSISYNLTHLLLALEKGNFFLLCFFHLIGSIYPSNLCSHKNIWSVASPVFKFTM